MMNHEEDATFLAEINNLLRSQSRILKESFAHSTQVIQDDISYLKQKFDTIQESVVEARELTNSLALGSVASLSLKRKLTPTVVAQVHSSDFFLRSEVISDVSISSITRYISAHFSVGTDDSLSLSEILRLILFAPSSFARRKARKTDVGRRFVDMRKKIIANMVFNCTEGAGKETSPLMQAIICSNGQDFDESQPTNSTFGPVKALAWTKMGFITRQHIESSIGEMVKDESEDWRSSPDSEDLDVEVGNVQTQVTMKRRKTMEGPRPSVRDEIAREIVKHMWKRWTDWFSNSRTEARKMFTFDLGVVFLDPSSRWKPICSCSSIEDYFGRVDSVPLTEKSSILQACYETTCSNVSLFKKTKEDFPNFVINCQYNVEVFQSSENLAQNKGGEEITLRRTVNLLQVAATFLTAFFQVANLDVFLGASKESIRLIFLVALSFAEIVSRASRPRVGNKAGERIWAEAKELGLLIPGDVGRLNFVIERCLRMTRKSFDEINLEGIDEESGQDVLSQDVICSDDEDVENVF